MKRKCCREGTVASTDDNYVPLGKLVHICRHFIFSGVLVSPSAVQTLSASIDNIV